MAKTIVTVRYESDAPYTDAEKSVILEGITDAVIEMDGDADKNSFTITAMTEAEEKEAETKRIFDTINDSTFNITLAVSNGSADVSIPMIEDLEG